MAQKMAKANQSVEKALQLVEVLAQAREPMRLQDVAEAAGLPPSTALRMLHTLILCGYANQDPMTLRYGLTLKFAYIGSLISVRLDVRNLAHPLLLELSARCGESCCLAVEENRQVVYVDVVDGPDGMLQIMQRIGKRAPLYCTGVGKIFLLNGGQEGVEEYIRSHGLPPLTDHTITSREGLFRELDKIRRQGFAIDDEECEQGARCVAAGVRDYTGQVVAGISVSGPLHRMTAEHLQPIIRAVQQTAQQLSRLLAYGGAGA